jgi:hypothetical protein
LVFSEEKGQRGERRLDAISKFPGIREGSSPLEEKSHRGERLKAFWNPGGVAGA